MVAVLFSMIKNLIIGGPDNLFFLEIHQANILDMGHFYSHFRIVIH